MITDVYKNKEIFSSYGFRKNCFAFSGTKTVAGGVKNIVVCHIPFKGRVIFGYIFNIPSEIDKIVVNTFSECGSRIHNDQL